MERAVDCWSVAGHALTGGWRGAGGVIQAADVRVQLAEKRSHLPADHTSLGFGKCFADHMLEIDWTAEKGWEQPIIRPYGPFTMAPSAMVFHYAIECFEGLKAYHGVDGKIRLFRPEMNMKRMLRSMKRLGLPSFDGSEFLELIKQLVTIDRHLIPSTRGCALYIRPTGIATDEQLGVHMAHHAKLFVITSPVSGYFKDGFKPVRLLATSKYQRAWPGGTGDAKIGGNYAPTIRPCADANAQKFDQILWLGADNNISEVGTMNLFIVKEISGGMELITPPLDGTILPGVTRQSVLDLAREHDDFAKVSERRISMQEVAEAAEAGTLLEMFGAGTAATISPIRSLSFDDHEIVLPNTGYEAAKKMTQRIFDIQYGNVPEHPWAPIVTDSA